MLSKWKHEADSQLYTLFQDNASKEWKVQKEWEVEINDFYAQIEKPEWLKKSSSELNVRQRCLLVDMKGAALSISVHAELLNPNRSRLYYHPIPLSWDNLAVKLRIYNICISYPMHGYRQICWYLNEKETTPSTTKPFCAICRKWA